MTRQPCSAGGRPARDRRRGMPAGTIAAYAAAATAFGYAAVSLYWAAGGTLLLGTLGGTLEDIARRGGLPAVALGLTATGLKAAGGILALALVRPWGRIVRRKWLLTVAGIASAVLICYGAVQMGAGALVLSGAVHPRGAVDREALRWHVALWDMWFLVWGLLLAVAAVAHWRHPLSPSPPPTPPASAWRQYLPRRCPPRNP